MTGCSANGDTTAICRADEHIDWESLLLCVWGGGGTVKFAYRSLGIDSVGSKADGTIAKPKF